MSDFVKQYRQQRSNARTRKIPWSLTYGQWFEIWATSGKIDQRGRLGTQYCMARYRDSGPYEVGNVKIISMKENRAEQENSGRSKKPPKPDEPIKAQILRLLSLGLITCSEAAHIFGRSKQIINYWCSQRGVNIKEARGRYLQKIAHE